MIAPTRVAEVRRLLTEGMLSQRKIARLTSVRRGAVGAIASGRRSEHRARYEEASARRWERRVCPLKG